MFHVRNYGEIPEITDPLISTLDLNPWSQPLISTLIICRFQTFFILRWWFHIFFIFLQKLRKTVVKWSNLINIFRMGWNHQLEHLLKDRLTVTSHFSPIRRWFFWKDMPIFVGASWWDDLFVNVWEAGMELPPVPLFQWWFQGPPIMGPPYGKLPILFPYL